MRKRKFQPRFQSARAGAGIRRKFVAPRRLAPRNVGFYRRSGFYGRFAGTGGEMKFHDLDIDDAVVAVNGTIAEDSCITIAEGNGESERVGRKITIRKIQWKYDLILASTATAANTSDSVRVILYQDKQCNGAAATALNILKTDDFQSFNNLSNSARFKILYTRTHQLSCPSGSGRGTTDTLSYGEQSRNYSMNKNCNIVIEYDSSATTGAIATIRSNNIGVLLVGKSGLCNFSSKMRLRFTDH